MNKRDSLNTKNKGYERNENYESDNNYERMCFLADELKQKMRDARREFHRHAEAGWCEVRTTSVIAKRLADMGYSVLAGRGVCKADKRMGLPTEEELERQFACALQEGAEEPWASLTRGGFTGLIADLDCGEGPTIALRFDMDALRIAEDDSRGHRPQKEGFRSVNEGVMHACGHDAHIAVGLAVAEILMQYRAELKGRVRLIFQPAEEGVRGARSIVENGHLDDVDFVIANHMKPAADLENCDVYMSIGPSLATSKLDVVFSGLAAHAGSDPEQGRNALLAACTAVLNLHAIPRVGGCETRVNAGTLHAGTARNVIPDRAEMELEVRGSSTEANAFMEERAHRILKAAADMYGCTCEISLAGAAPGMAGDLELIERCIEVCEEKLNLKVAPLGETTEVSEDFAYMVRRVQQHGGQGLLFWTISETQEPLHSRKFDLDENALPAAVKTFCGLVFDIMGI